MSAIDTIKDRLVLFREERGELSSRIIAGCLIGALLAGAYVTGKRVERQWWRTEIAAKSAAVKTIMSRLADDAPDFDARLIAEWSRDHADKLEEAERRLKGAKHDAESWRAEYANARDDRPRCSIPADCLRDGSRSGPSAGGAEGGPVPSRP